MGLVITTVCAALGTVWWIAAAMVAFVGVVGAQLLAWRDMREQRNTATDEIDRLTSHVLASLESQVDVQRINLPHPPGDQCIAITFGLKFINAAEARMAVTLKEARFTLHDPVTSNHEADVPIVAHAEAFILRPEGGEKWWNADHAVANAPRSFPGWIDGTGYYVAEYGAEGSPQRFVQTCDFRWRNHPNGNTDFILPGAHAKRDEPLP